VPILELARQWVYSLAAVTGKPIDPQQCLYLSLSWPGNGFIPWPQLQVNRSIRSSACTCSFAEPKHCHARGCTVDPAMRMHMSCSVVDLSMDRNGALASEFTARADELSRLAHISRQNNFEGGLVAGGIQ
jgi:hypothetical protein